jgi:hypothetical protein
MLKGVSINTTDAILLQLGDAGGVENTGYNGSFALAHSTAGATAGSSFSAGFILNSGSTNATLYGTVSLSLQSTANNAWMASGVISRTDLPQVGVLAGNKDLSAELDRLRLIAATTTAAFDLGEMNISYRP